MRNVGTATADARTGKRFPVQLPIRIHLWNSAEEQSGTTANVSVSGVYLQAEPKPASKDKANVSWRPGATVEFDITLPASVIGAPTDVRIHCRGRVVRVEKLKSEPASKGLACVIDKYEFVRKP